LTVLQIITMRSRQVIAVSLPREMMEQVEAIRKAEHRTRSELVREALRTYFALARRFPEDDATPAEIRALERAKREFQRGEYVTLGQLQHELESSRRKLGPKKHSTATSR
jgi:metal-responsive CopG/Arc/MetJ family transcriptional regulator